MLYIIIASIIVGFCTMPFGMAYPIETAITAGALFTFFGFLGYWWKKSSLALAVGSLVGIGLIFFAYRYLSLEHHDDQHFFYSFFLYLLLFLVILICAGQEKSLMPWGPLVSLATILLFQIAFPLFIFGVLRVKFG